MLITIDASKCFECGNTAHEQHHVIPQTRGGQKTIPLCSPCHGKVHNIKRSDNHSKLTKEGLARAKARGVKLGNPENFSHKTRIKGAESMKEMARRNPNNLKALPVILRLREEENLSYGKIGDYLNDNNYKTAKGCEFTDTAVMRIYKRNNNKQNR